MLSASAHLTSISALSSPASPRFPCFEARNKDHVSSPSSRGSRIGGSLSEGGKYVTGADGQACAVIATKGLLLTVTLNRFSEHSQCVMCRHDKGRNKMGSVQGMRKLYARNGRNSQIDNTLYKSRRQEPRPSGVRERPGGAWSRR